MRDLETRLTDARRGKLKRCTHGHKRGCVPESWPTLPLTDEAISKGVCLWGLINAMELAAIESALDLVNHNRTKAAALLGLSRTTFTMKMKSFGMPLGQANPRAKKFCPTCEVPAESTETAAASAEESPCTA